MTINRDSKYPDGMFIGRLVVELKKALDLTDTLNPSQRLIVKTATEDLRYCMNDTQANDRLHAMLRHATREHRGGDLLDRCRTIAVNYDVLRRGTARQSVLDRIIDQEAW